MLLENNDIEVVLDNKPTCYEIEKLKNEGRNFKVDCRYRIKVPINDIENSHSLILMLKFLKGKIVGLGEETDENLYAVSFNCYSGGQWCVGTLGDIPGIEYHFGINSIELNGKFKTHLCCFYISYVEDHFLKEGLDAWLAVEPCDDEKIE